MERVEPGRPMNKAFKALAAILMAFCLVSVMATAQQTDQNQSDQKQKKDDIPDAPSASRPFPGNLPPPTEGNPASPPDANSLPEPTYAPGVAPPMNVKTVPEGGATQERSASGEELFRLRSNVNQVVVPVMVKDGTQRMVNGLLSRDFAVFEDGKKQNLNFFTTDPFA